MISYGAQVPKKLLQSLSTFSNNLDHGFLNSVSLPALPITFREIYTLGGAIGECVVFMTNRDKEIDPLWYVYDMVFFFTNMPIAHIG